MRSDEHGVVTSALTVEVIEDADRFDALRDEWNAAALASVDPNVFLTWDWLRTWWRHFGETDPCARLSVVVLRDDQGLVAAAPLYRTRQGVGPVRATVLQPVSYDAGDYGGILLLRRYDEVAAVLLDHLTAQLGEDVGTVVLSRLTADSAFLTHLRATLDQRAELAATEVSLDDACPFADVSDGYNLGRHLKKHKIRQRMRRIEGKYEVIFEQHTGASLETGLERVVDVHRRRWEGREEDFRGLLAAPKHEAFLFDAIRALDRRGWLLLTTLTADDRVAAVEVDFEFAQRVYMFKAAIDPEFSEFSPGHLLTYHLFEDGIARGVEEFDFMRGDHPYKRRWATGNRHLVTLRLTRPGWRGKVASRRQWVARALAVRLHRSLVTVELATMGAVAMDAAALI